LQEGGTFRTLNGGFDDPMEWGMLSESAGRMRRGEAFSESVLSIQGADQTGCGRGLPTAAATVRAKAKAFVLKKNAKFVKLIIKRPRREALFEKCMNIEQHDVSVSKRKISLCMIQVNKFI